MATKPLNFEKGMERLEEITGLLDMGGVALENAIALYEEGCKIADALQKKLEKAERAVSIAPVGQEAPNTEENLQQIHDINPASGPKPEFGGEPTLF